MMSFEDLRLTFGSQTLMCLDSEILSQFDRKLSIDKFGKLARSNSIKLVTNRLVVTEKCEN
jgi:hypothetical protein